jgi:hypothetical protein
MPDACSELSALVSSYVTSYCQLKGYFLNSLGLDHSATEEISERCTYWLLCNGFLVLVL